MANHNERKQQPGEVAGEAEDEREVARIADGLGPESSSGVAIAGAMRAGEAGSVPSTDKTRWAIEVGADVIGACGHKVGEVVAIREDHVVVEKGFFMPVDFYIPKSAIHHHNEHGLFLNVSKTEALHRGWDVDPLSIRRAS